MPLEAAERVELRALITGTCGSVEYDSEYDHEYDHEYEYERDTRHRSPITCPQCPAAVGRRPQALQAGR